VIVKGEAVRASHGRPSRAFSPARSSGSSHGSGARRWPYGRIACACKGQFVKGFLGVRRRSRLHPDVSTKPAFNWDFRFNRRLFCANWPVAYRRSRRSPVRSAGNLRTALAAAAECHQSAEPLLDRALASLEHLNEVAEAMMLRLDELLTA
jgi:hypothetical protein